MKKIKKSKKKNEWEKSKRRVHMQKNIVNKDLKRREAQRREVNIVPSVSTTHPNPYQALSSLNEENENNKKPFSSFRLYTAITRLNDPNYDREKVKEAIYNQYEGASIKRVSTYHPVIIKIVC